MLLLIELVLVVVSFKTGLFFYMPNIGHCKFKVNMFIWQFIWLIKKCCRAVAEEIQLSGMNQQITL